MNIIKKCLENRFLLDKELVSLFSNLCLIDLELSENILMLLMQSSKSRIITRDVFIDSIEKIISLINSSKGLSLEGDKRIEKINTFICENFNLPEKEKTKAEEVEEEKIKEIKGIKIIASYSVPSKKIEVKDFVKYFKERFVTLRNLLQERNELKNLISINKISGIKQDTSLIGLVYKKKITKNKNIIFEIEDLTGRATLLATRNKKEIFEKAEEIVLDEILGFRCSGNKEMLFINDIIFPDAFVMEKKNAEKEEYAIFLSDLHIGSKKFLEAEFLNFIKWLNLNLGSEKQKEIAKKLKYIFIVGDIVDGIGVYPGQEEEIFIKDIVEQYNKAAELLGKIRDDINLIICPGNHDAVRIAEPQPILDEKYASALYKLKNAIFVSNPSIVNIASTKLFSGFDVLLYHGYSFDYFANNVDRIRLNGSYRRPDMLINFLLKRRHLAPTHSSTLYIPTEQDNLVIRKTPDIFVSAHIHKSAVSQYNGILTVSSSCWQAKTAFQEKVGHEPDPCKVPILNLKTRKMNVLDFS